jgi:hypothetical protein
MKGSAVQWNVTIPPNTTAQLPLNARQQSEYSLDGVAIAKSTKVHAAGDTNGQAIYLLPAGTYSFTVVADR